MMEGTTSTDSKLIDIFRENFHDLAKLIELNLITAANVLYSKRLITREIQNKVYTKGVTDYQKASELVTALLSMLEAKSNKQLYFKKVFKALSDEGVIEKEFLRKLGIHEETDDDKKNQKQKTHSYELRPRSCKRHCFCGLEAKLRISRRKRSRGRRFYNCPKPYSRKWNSQCDYFEWADQPREPLHVLVTLVCGHCRKKGHKTINCFLA